MTETGVISDFSSYCGDCGYTLELYPIMFPDGTINGKNVSVNQKFIVL